MWYAVAIVAIVMVLPSLASAQTPTATGTATATATLTITATATSTATATATNTATATATATATSTPTATATPCGSLVQATFGTSSSCTTTVTSHPFTPTAGHLIVVNVTTASNSISSLGLTITDSQENTWIPNPENSSACGFPNSWACVQQWSTIANASTSDIVTIGFGTAGTGTCLNIVGVDEFSGNAPSAMYDTSAVAIDGFTTTDQTGLTATPAQLAEIVDGFAGVNAFFSSGDISRVIGPTQYGNASGAVANVQEITGSFSSGPDAAQQYEGWVDQISAGVEGLQWTTNQNAYSKGMIGSFFCAGAPVPTATPTAAPTCTTVAYIGGNQCYSGNGPGNCPVAVPTPVGGVLPGDLMLWTHSVGVGDWNPPNAGVWTQITATASGLLFGYHIATSHEPANYQTSSTDAHFNYFLSVYRNENQGAPIEGLVQNKYLTQPPLDSAATCGSVTPANTGDAYACLVDISTGNGSAAPGTPSGMNARLTSSLFEALGDFDLLSLTGGAPTGTSTSSLGADNNWYTTAFGIVAACPSGTPTATPSPAATPTPTATIMPTTFPQCCPTPSPYASPIP